MIIEACLIRLVGRLLGAKYEVAVYDDYLVQCIHVYTFMPGVAHGLASIKL